MNSLCILVSLLSPLHSMCKLLTFCVYEINSATQNSTQIEEIATPSKSVYSLEVARPAKPAA